MGFNLFFIGLGLGICKPKRIKIQYGIMDRKI